MKRPSTLYRYDLNKTLCKHKIERSCAPQVQITNQNKILWRCRHGGEIQHCDHYGFSTKIQAMEEELTNSRMDLLKLRAHISRLERNLEKKIVPDATKS